MSQLDVLEVLRRSDVPLSARQISVCSGLSFDLVMRTLRKLLVFKEVECILVGREDSKKFFNSLRGLRLYYLSGDDGCLLRAKKTLPFL